MVATPAKLVIPNGTIPAEERADYAVIADLVQPESEVLDLGCGNGDLLLILRQKKHVEGHGLEISEEGIKECIRKGLTVAHTNIDEGLTDYGDKSFDTVILCQTLQAVMRPNVVLDEMLRVGKQGIVCFPNFAHWEVRFQFLCTGRMPKTQNLPYDWYDTPNLHHLTISDFRRYCHTRRYRILREYHLSSLRPQEARRVAFMPNLRARYGLFVIANLEA